MSKQKRTQRFQKFLRIFHPSMAEPDTELELRWKSYLSRNKLLIDLIEVIHPMVDGDGGDLIIDSLITRDAIAVRLSSSATKGGEARITMSIKTNSLHQPLTTKVECQFTGQTRGKDYVYKFDFTPHSKEALLILPAQVLHQSQFPEATSRRFLELIDEILIAAGVEDK